MNAITQSGKKITLNDHAEIHRGGEGRILLVPELPDMVAKLYLNQQNAIRKEQVKALRVLDGQCFVKPLELIYDTANGLCLGFLMSYIPQTFVPLTALFSEPFCRRHQLTDVRKRAIALSLQNAMLQAHQQGIVIGDLSGLNVLVNPNTDEVKLIDVDSYGTSVQAHSGTLLDEIRDYYYGGLVSRESDLFAFGVLLFQLLTYTHPFKGVLPSYPTLRERMIKQIPVFAAVPQLTVPKCYRPVADISLQQQFEAMFLHGHRMPIDLTTGATATGYPFNIPAAPVVNVLTGSLDVKMVYLPLPDETVLDWSVSVNKGVLKTNRQWIVFDLSQRGSAKIIHQFDLTIADDIFVSPVHIVVRKGETLGVLDNKGGITFFENISIGKDARLMQFQNLLAVVEDDYLKVVHLDNIRGKFIEVTQTPVFGKGIMMSQGAMWQLVGGKRFVFYHSGNNLSSAVCPLAIQDLLLQGNQGIVTYRTNMGNQETTLVSSYCKISDLQLQLTGNHGVIGSLKHFAYQPQNKQEGIIFEPADNQLIIRRTEDGAIMQTLACSEISDFDQLYFTQAGIVCFSVEGELRLLNKN